MKKSIVVIIIFWSALLGVVSTLSGYDALQVGSINFDIATMLTPLGLVKTFLLEQNEVLRPHYFETLTRKDSVVDETALLISIMMFQGASFAGLFLLRRSKP